MKLLLDTNIFLEVLLEQAKADDARALLRKVTEHDFFISDFSLHSIGLILLRRRQPEVFRQFLSDIMIDAGVILAALSASEMGEVITAAGSFNLDFDDAYQYAVASQHGLTLVSFDRDFDRTDQGRVTPAEVA